MKERAPGSKPPPQEVDAIELSVRAGVLRCPYCHDDCRPEEAVVCRDCLARHHAACWQEHGSCSTCASTHRLVTDSQDREAEAPRIRVRPSPAETGPPAARALFAVQALLLGGASGLAAEGAVWSSLAVILLCGLALGAVHLRRRTRRSLAIQGAFLALGLTLAPLLIVSLDIAPGDSSLAIWALGMGLALCSGFAAALLPAGEPSQD